MNAKPKTQIETGKVKSVSHLERKYIIAGNPPPSQIISKEYAGKHAVDLGYAIIVFDYSDGVLMDTNQFSMKLIFIRDGLSEEEVIYDGSVSICDLISNLYRYLSHGVAKLCIIQSELANHIANCMSDITGVHSNRMNVYGS